MSNTSPSVVLYSSDGYELAVVNGVSIPTNTRAILSAGSDGTNAREMLVDSSARQVVVGAGTAGTQTGGVLTVQGDPSGTPVPVSGTVTATNPSVAVVPGAPPADATYVGALVNTSTPSGYTSGNMYSLSLTTTGLLRVDGSNVTQPVSGSGNFTVVQPTAASLNATVVQATAANLNATVVGTTAAGSGASTGLITIQGNASGTPVPVSGSVVFNKSSTGTLTSVAAATSSTTLLASNANRQGATFYNDSSAIMYLSFNATSSTTAFTIKILPNSYYEMTTATYTGAISGIWASATGNMRVTELT